MVMQSLNISSRDVVLIDDPLDDLKDAELFGSDYIFVHNLQTRRQRFPHGLGMTDFPQWFESKRMLIPYETRVSCLEATDEAPSEFEFAPAYLAPESALLDARRILVPSPSIGDLETRIGVGALFSIPSDKSQAFSVGQSRFHVLHDFFIACAETTTDPVRTLHALVAKTEGYCVRRVRGSGGSKDEEKLDLPPAVSIDRERFLMELLARRLEERFFWNWKLHAIVASRRGSRDQELPMGVFSKTRWEDELGNPFSVQMLYRIRARQDEGFPVNEVSPWSGTGRYMAEDLPRHWHGSLVGLRHAVDNKEYLEHKAKGRKQRKKENRFRGILTSSDGSKLGVSPLDFDRFGLTEGACAFLDGLHPDCEDIDLPLRLMGWLKAPDAATEAAMARYLRTWFGKLFRHQGAELKAMIEMS